MLKRSLLLVCGLVIGAVAVVALQHHDGVAYAAPSDCQVWHVAVVAQSSLPASSESIPRPFLPPVVLPRGWEPFGGQPGGGYYIRKCAQ